MVEIRIAETVHEKEAVFRFRYAVYVEEMGRYKGVADRVDRRLSDPEDEWSWISYALDGDEIVGTLRMTWGGAGFSDRLMRQYGLQPFLDELPPEMLAVGERAMVSPTWRGEALLAQLGSVIEPLLEGGDESTRHTADAALRVIEQAFPVTAFSADAVGHGH